MNSEIIKILEEDLEAACKNGNIKKATILLKNGITSNVGPDHLFDLGKNNLEIVKLLKKQYDKIILKPMTSRNILFLTIKNNDIEFFQNLIEEKINIFVHNIDGDSLLSIACKKGFIEIVKILLNHGYIVDQKITDNAIKNGHTNIVEELIKKGANIERSISTAYYSKKQDIVTLLISAKADTNNVKVGGNSLLYGLSKNGYASAIEKMLQINKNIDIDYHDKDGFTILDKSILGKHTQIAMLLIKSNATLNTCSYEGKFSPLTNAAYYGFYDIVKELVTRKADINFQVKAGHSALMNASTKGHLNIVKFLIENKANPQFKNGEGNDALTLAIIGKHINIAKLLLNNNSAMNQVNNKGFTLLISASNNNLITIAKEIIEMKTDINKVTKDGYTALSFAARNGNYEIAKLLIESKANVNHQTKNGTSILMGAISSHNIDLIKLLIKSGACTNHCTNKGTSIMDLISNDHEICEIIMGQ